MLMVLLTNRAHSFRCCPQWTAGGEKEKIKIRRTADVTITNEGETYPELSP